jgi:glycine dehydrogenase subunit 2
MSKLTFDKSVPGRRGVGLPANDMDASVELPSALRRDAPAALAELSELDVVRHFTQLAQKNFGIDSGFYPLGSCTMKYNPKMAERAARLPGFAELHPLLPQLPGGAYLARGALTLLHETDLLLREICGMAEFTLQPLAGAHGELAGAMIMAAYHADRGNTQKTTILIPDSAHGTNPASAAIAGFTVKAVPSDDNGLMCLETLRDAIDETTAGLMLTCPNTLGLFNSHVEEICQLIHEVDGLVYYDGANLNPLLGRARPGDLGFDIVHVNLHKTFATPHGGGGPGAGPVGVVDKLVNFLPISVVKLRGDGSYGLDYDRPKSIGYIAPFYGNFGVVLRAYAYMLMLGRDGLRAVADHAVLNANYVRVRLADTYDAACDGVCMHECVFTAARQAKGGVKAMDLAKAIIDRGFHPPTVYFPLTVKEAMMIEPTETESKEMLDAFVAAMVEVAALAETDPDSFAAMPTTTPIGRPDEVLAARKPDLADLPGKDGS